MNKEAILLIFKTIQELKDKKVYEYNVYTITNKLQNYLKAYKHLAELIKTSDVNIISKEEYQVLFYRYYNGLKDIKLKDVLLSEPATENFSDSFYTNKYQQVKHLKRILIKRA